MNCFVYFQNLYKGNVIEFGFIYNLTKFAFKVHKDHAISNVTKFIRKAKFVRDESGKALIC